MASRILVVVGSGVIAAALASPALAIPESPKSFVPSRQPQLNQGEGAPRLTARAVSGGAVRSNTLLPLGGSEVINNSVPTDLEALSGLSPEELQESLQREHPVDVVAVTRYLYSPEGEAFLAEGIGQSNYVPYDSQANGVQAVRSAIIADAADGSLSGYGMMANLPTDQRLQGPMTNCRSRGDSDSAAATSLLAWYATTPGCIQERTAQALPQQGSSTAPMGEMPVRGMW